MRKSIFSMLALLVLPAALRAQQWSSDPVVDHLKRLEAEVIKAQDFMVSCEQPENRHENRCSGVNAAEATHTKFTTWEEAMKLAGENPVPLKQTSLGETARQFRVQKLQKKIQPVVADFCMKNPATKICSLATPSVIALQLSEKYDGFEEKLVATQKRK